MLYGDVPVCACVGVRAGLLSGDVRVCACVCARVCLYLKPLELISCSECSVRGQKGVMKSGLKVSQGLSALSHYREPRSEF